MQTDILEVLALSSDRFEAPWVKAVISNILLLYLDIWLDIGMATLQDYTQLSILLHKQAKWWSIEITAVLTKGWPYVQKSWLGPSDILLQ